MRTHTEILCSRAGGRVDGSGDSRPGGGTEQASLVGTLTGHTDPVYAVAWSPDGKTLATAGFDNTVRLWDSATRKEIKSFEGHTKLVLTVAYSPDGRHLVSGSLDNSVRIWDLPLRAGADARRASGERRRRWR